MEASPGGAAVWPIGPRIGRADILALCERLDALVRGGAAVVVCDVSRITEPDATTIDALARLHLTARRRGAVIRIRGANDRLRELMAFTGLDDLLPVDAGLRVEGLRVEPRGQAEQREQALGVEERVDPLDPAG